MWKDLFTISILMFEIITNLRERKLRLKRRVGYRGNLVLRFPSEARRDFFFFCFSTAFCPTLGPMQTPFQYLPGTLSPEVMRPGYKADHCHFASRLGIILLSFDFTVLFYEDKKLLDTVDRRPLRPVGSNHHTRGWYPRSQLLEINIELLISSRNSLHFMGIRSSLPPLVHILSQMNPIQTMVFCFF
jgi:hypothetical protein